MRRPVGTQSGIEIRAFASTRIDLLRRCQSPYGAALARLVGAVPGCSPTFATPGVLPVRVRVVPQPS